VFTVIHRLLDIIVWLMRKLLERGDHQGQAVKATIKPGEPIPRYPERSAD